MGTVTTPEPSSPNYWELYEQQQDTDINFEVKTDSGTPKEFRLHKKVLAESSNVFHDMFYGGKGEKYKKIVVKDVKVPAFEAIIKFAYKNEAEFEGIEYACKVGHASKKYDIPDLYNLSIRYIYENLTTKNAILILETGSALDTNLVDRALWMIREDFSTAEESEHYLKLSAKNFLFLVENIRHHISAGQLFQLALTWAKNACAVESIEASRENIRSRMEPILPYIKFLQMPAPDFISDVLLSDVLTSDEAGAVGNNISCKEMKYPLPPWCSRANSIRSKFTLNRKPDKLKDLENTVHYTFTSIFSVSEDAELLSLGFELRWDLKYRDEPVLLRVELKCVEKKETMFFEVKHQGSKEFFLVKLDLLKPFPIEGNLNAIHELSVTRVPTTQNFSVYAKKFEHSKFDYEFSSKRSQRKNFKVKFQPSPNGSINELEFAYTHPSYLV